MDAFATTAQLSALLNREFSIDETEQVEALLAVASDHIRAVVGQDIFPQRRVTFKAWPDVAGRVDLPQQPVVEVHSVTGGFDYDGESVTAHASGPVDVEFTYGYAEPPEFIASLTCVLAAQAFKMLELGLGLSAGGLSSVAIDDFRAAFADGGEQTGISLTPRNEALLRERFGAPGGTYVVRLR